eukprot:TRINITY_DN17884_c0_g1_i1.p1 TRINITY_DN17884_c0_g1~~TRINITY_DN17884_c0_g1_i1.p1  ORF type:complete len:787 (-),score=150.25 TRINITY_DN17884_c0_g1_i1:211-2571(-)
MPDSDSDGLLGSSTVEEVIVSGYQRRLRQWRQAGPVRRRHIALMVCTLSSYGYVLSVLDGRRELTSAAWREILGELYPDAAKSAERLTEAEVVPRWAETMHADDVTKNINWFQTFCRDKYGMDDHISFYWQCGIESVSVDFDRRGLPPLDPSMDCSASFLHRHIVQGDDPRCVPWGDKSLELLGRLLEAEGKGDIASQLANVDSMYDEFSVHAGSPLFEPVQAKLSTLEEQIGELKALMLNSSRVGAAATVASSTPPPRRRQRRRRRRRRRLTDSGGAGSTNSAAFIAADLGDEDECPALKAGCSAFSGAPEPDASELPCRCFSEDGRPASTCRNHHWGLMHLCRPSAVSVVFEIKRIVCDQGHPVRCTPMLWFRAELLFAPIQGLSKSSEPSGWYTARLQLDEGKCFGNITQFQGVIGFVAVALLIWFLLQGPIWSIVCFPYHFASIMELRHWTPTARSSELLQLARSGAGSDDDESPGAVEERQQDAREQALREEFEARLGRLLTGVSGRLAYMARIDVLFENIGGAFVLLGCIASTYGMLRRYVAEYAKDGSELESNVWHYMLANYTGLQLVAEVLYQFLFDENTFHTIAWFTLYVCTLMLVFDSFEGLQWLPAIARLACTRLTYFSVGYCSFIFGFGLVFWIQFGARFVQFSTLTRAWCELFFLACGVPFHVFDDINPFYDNDSFLASCFLALYLVLIVVIGVNFFTTILLDAYSLAKKPRHADYAMTMTRKSLNEALMRWLGILRAPGDADANEDSDRDFDPLSSSPSGRPTRTSSRRLTA